MIGLWRLFTDRDEDTGSYRLTVPLFQPVYHADQDAWFLERGRAPGGDPGFHERLNAPFPSCEEAQTIAVALNDEMKRHLQRVVAKQLDRYAGENNIGTWSYTPSFRTKRTTP